MEKQKTYISKEDELALIRRAQAGDLSARDELIQAHSDFLWKSATKWHRGSGKRAYELDDCFQVATIGLMRGIELFDCESGTRLLTYADYWIYQKLQMMTEQLSVVVVRKGCGKSEKNKPFAQNARRCASLATPVGEGDGTLADMVLGDDDVRDIAEERDENRYNKNVIDGLLKVVPQRYREIAKVYFGGRTLKETGEVFGITRERVRQITSKAILKMKREAARRYPNGLFETRERDVDVEAEFAAGPKGIRPNRRSNDPREFVSVKPPRPKPLPVPLASVITSRKRRTRMTGDSVSMIVALQTAASTEAQRVLNAVRAAFSGRT